MGLEEVTRNRKAYIAGQGYGPILIGETVAAGANLAAGTILGRVTRAAGTPEYDPGNTGNGTVTGVALKASVQVGNYVLTCTAEAENAGTFSVEPPTGNPLANATVGTPYVSAHLNFTIGDGAEDWNTGDIITIPVTAGSAKFKAYDVDNTDGTQTAIGVLMEAAAAASDDTEAVVGFAGVYVEDNMVGLDAAGKSALEARGIYFV